MALNPTNTGAISFKKLSGKAHTQQNFAVTEEGIATNVQMSYATVFANPIEPLPVTNSGLTTLYSTNGIVERVKFQIDLIPDTQIAVGKSQGYKLKLPSDYNTFGELYPQFSAGTYLYTALGKLQIVPALYGKLKPDGSTEYDPILYQTNGSTVIPKFDPINWYIDPYDGILFVQDPPAGYDTSASRPGYLEAFLYVGDYVDDLLNIMTTGSTGTTGLNVGGGAGVFKDKVGNNLRFKSLVGSGGIAVSALTNTIALSFTGSTGGGTITGATNGLHVTGAGKKIALGGSLTGDTQINGADTHLLLLGGNGVPGNLLGGFSVFTTGTTSNAPIYFDWQDGNDHIAQYFSTSGFKTISFVTENLLSGDAALQNFQTNSVLTQVSNPSNSGQTTATLYYAYNQILSQNNFSNEEFELTVGFGTSQRFTKSDNTNNLQSGLFFDNGLYGVYLMDANNNTNEVVKINAKLNNFTIDDSRTGDTQTGIQYASDYSANYTARSLVDAAFVTGMTSGSSVNAANGLTKIGSTVVLGGSLTGTTIIASDGSATGQEIKFGYFGPGQRLGRYSVFTTGSTGTQEWDWTNGDDNINFTLFADSKFISMQSSDNANSTSSSMLLSQTYITAGASNATDSTSFSMLPNAFIIQGTNTATFPGAQYNDDYTANFTERSLVDKGYVDSAISTAFAVESIDSDSGVDVDTSNKLILVDTSSGPVNITLSEGAPSGRIVKIKDKYGAASTNNIVVDGDSFGIDNNTTATINSNLGALELTFSSDDATWYVTGFVN